MKHASNYTPFLKRLLGERPGSTLLLSASLVFGLSACTPTQEREVDQHARETRENAEEAAKSLEQSADKAAAELREAAHDVRQELSETRREIDAGEPIIDRNKPEAPADRALHPEDPADARDPAPHTAGERVAAGIERAGKAIGGAVDKAGEAMSDAAIATRINSKYALDDLVKASEINVDVHDGVATLRGSVRTLEAKDRAERLARETSGVLTVKNKIEVEP